jgi:cyclic pyranopterin phosphate synthase
VSRINVSLDSLQAERIAQIAGRDVLPKILSGLEAGKRAGFSPIKINMVAMRGVNDDEIADMVTFCMQHGYTLRLIETMPMGDTGRNTQHLDLQPVKAQLQQQFGLIPGVVDGCGPARYLQTPDGKFTVGFITPMSQHFCATCNRVRLTVDGTLYLCLGQDEKVELRPLLRNGASDQDLELAIQQAMTIKPERHEFREQPAKLVRFMSMTGG